MNPRIYLEKLSAQDFESFYTLAGNEQVMELITGKPQTRDEARVKFLSLLENNKWKKPLGSFMAFERSGSQLLGFAKLEIKGANHSEAELGYMLLPEFWGKGLGSEIAGTLLEVAISDPNLTRVYAITDPNNLASRKILINKGFASEEVGEIDGLPSEIFGRRV